MENRVATVSSVPAVPSGMAATLTQYSSSSGPAQPPPKESIARPASRGTRPRMLGRPREVNALMGFSDTNNPLPDAANPFQPARITHSAATTRRTDTCRNGRHATAVISTIATNAEANGAARPNRCASTPPSAEPIAAPPTEASRYTLFTRPISGSGVASCRAVVDTIPHTTAWTPKTAMVAPATHGLRVSARTRCTVVSITSPARSSVSEPTRGSSRWYAGMPNTAPTAPTDISSPNWVSLSPSRSRAYSTHVANAAQNVMFMTSIEHANVRTPA